MLLDDNSRAYGIDISLVVHACVPPIRQHTLLTFNLLPSFLLLFFYKYSVSLDPPLTVRAQNSFGLEDNLGFLGIICVGKNCKSLFSIIWNVFRIFEMLLRVGRMPLPYFCNSLHLFKISSISTIFFHWDHFRKGIFFERDWFGTRPIPKDDLLELYGLFRGFSWCAPEFFL